MTESNSGKVSINEIKYLCPCCGKNESFKGEELAYQLPNIQGVTFNFLVPCENGPGYSQMEISTRDIAAGTPSNEPVKLELDHIDNIVFRKKGEVSEEYEVTSVKKFIPDESMFLRDPEKVYELPLDTDIFASKNDLIGEKGTYKRKKFKFGRGNRGVLYINKPGQRNKKGEERGIVFVPQTHQDENSLDGLLKTIESSEAAWISRKQKGQELTKVGIEEVPITLCLPDEDIDYLQENMNQHYNHYSTKSTNKMLKIFSPESREAKEVITRQIKNIFGFKNITRKALISILAAVFPIAGIPVTAYYLKQAYDKITNSINASSTGRLALQLQLETLNSQIATSESSLNTLLEGSHNTYEQYASEIEADDNNNYDTLKEQLDAYQSSMVDAQAEVNDSTLNSLDNFMRSNGAIPVDIDSDGFTDKFIANYTIVTEGTPGAVQVDLDNDGILDAWITGTEVNPLQGVNPGDLPPGVYDELMQEWNDLQDYESAREDYNNFNENTYNPYVEELNHYHDLITGRETVQSYLAAKVAEISSLETQLNIALGFLISLGAGAGLSVLSAVYLQKRFNRFAQGTDLPVLLPEQLGSVYSHNYKIKRKSLEQLVTYDPEKIEEEVTKKLKEISEKLEEYKDETGGGMYADTIKLRVKKIDNILEGSQEIDKEILNTISEVGPIVSKIYQFEAIDKVLKEEQVLDRSFASSIPGLSEIIDKIDVINQQITGRYAFNPKFNVPVNLNIDEFYDAFFKQFSEQGILGVQNSLNQAIAEGNAVNQEFFQEWLDFFQGLGDLEPEIIKHRLVNNKEYVYQLCPNIIPILGVGSDTFLEQSSEWIDSVTKRNEFQQQLGEANQEIVKILTDKKAELDIDNLRQDLVNVLQKNKQELSNEFKTISQKMGDSHKELLKISEENKRIKENFSTIIEDRIRNAESDYFRKQAQLLLQDPQVIFSKVYEDFANQKKIISDDDEKKLAINHYEELKKIVLNNPFDLDKARKKVKAYFEKHNLIYNLTGMPLHAANPEMNLDNLPGVTVQ